MSNHHNFFGNIYQYNAGTQISIDTKDAWYKVTGWSQNGCDGCSLVDDTLVVKGGHITALYKVCFDNGARSVKYKFGLKRNDEFIECLYSHSITNVMAEGMVVGVGSLQVYNDDIISLWVSNKTNADDITIEHASMLVGVV
jgi:hypothetical protein